MPDGAGFFPLNFEDFDQDQIRPVACGTWHWALLAALAAGVLRLVVSRQMKDGRGLASALCTLHSAACGLKAVSCQVGGKWQVASETRSKTRVQEKKSKRTTFDSSGCPQ
jgi:hypothetical protein